MNSGSPSGCRSSRPPRKSWIPSCVPVGPRYSSPSSPLASTIAPPQSRVDRSTGRETEKTATQSNTSRSLGLESRAMPRSCARRRHAPSGIRPRRERAMGHPACPNAARTSDRYSSRRSCGSSGGERLSTDRTAASTEGRGSNAAAGRRRARRNSHHGSHPNDTRVPGQIEARFRAASDCTMRSARVSEEPGSSRSLRRRAVVSPNGTLPTTRNGSRGKGTCRMSPSTMMASWRPPNRRRRTSAKPASSSTATMLPAARASGSVILPVPAPTSKTSSSSATPSCPTISPASERLRRRC
jgi:hypothetical protein